MKAIRIIKEKIIESLKGIKEYEVSYAEIVVYSKRFKAKNKEELKQKFWDGNITLDREDIVEGEFVDGSLEIEEWKND